MAVGDQILIDRLSLRESQLHQQADALDLKASILLVAVTFLAGQSAYLLGKYSTGFVHWEQFLASLFEIASGICLWWFLRVQDYSGEAAEDLRAWRDAIIGSDPVVEDTLRQWVIKRTTERINTALGINNEKAYWVKWAYIATFVAFFFNLVALEFLIF